MATLELAHDRVAAPPAGSGSSSSPISAGTVSSRHRRAVAPGLSLDASCPSTCRRTVAGPSAVRAASQASSRASRTVRSPSPCRKRPEGSTEIERPAQRDAALDHRRIERRIGVGPACASSSSARRSNAAVALGHDELGADLAEAGARTREQDDVGRVFAQRHPEAAREVVGASSAAREGCDPPARLGSVDHGVNRTPRPSMSVTFGADQVRPARRSAARAAASARSGMCHASCMAARNGKRREPISTAGSSAATPAIPTAGAAQHAERAELQRAVHAIRLACKRPRPAPTVRADRAASPRP